VFNLELDLSLFFVPPMDEHGRGIMLTRKFELPFPPTEGLSLAGQALNENPTGLGFVLESVTWDVDRQVFLAHTSLVEQGFPIPFIPQSLRSWLDRGWQLGTFEDNYENDEEPEAAEVPEVIDGSEQADADDEDSWEAAQKWPSMSPSLRPKHVTRMLRALVREMAESFNNSPTAYAIDQTKMVFSDQELQADDSPLKTRFKDAKWEYQTMPNDQRLAWHERVGRSYPKLARLVAET